MKNKKKEDVVSKEELLRFLTWFADWHTPTPRRSVLTTCMTGRFKMSSKQVEPIMKQAERNGMIRPDGDRVTITHN